MDLSLLFIARLAGSAAITVAALFSLRFAYSLLFPLFFELDVDDTEDFEARFANASGYYVLCMVLIGLFSLGIAGYLLNALWGYGMPVHEWLSALQKWKIRVGQNGECKLKLYHVVGVLGILSVSAPLATFFRKVLLQPIISVLIIQSGTRAVFNRLMHYFLITLFWCGGLHYIGLGYYVWQMILVLSFAITLGIKDIILDIFASVWLLVERSIEPTHFIEINGITGTVVDIGVRKTLIAAEYGTVSIPNRFLVSSILTNWSKANSRFGMRDIKVTFDNKKSFDEISKELKSIFNSTSEVYDFPRSQVHLDSFSNSNITILVRLALKKKYFDSQAEVVGRVKKKILENIALKQN